MSEDTKGAAEGPSEEKEGANSKASAHQLRRWAVWARNKFPWRAAGWFVLEAGVVGLCALVVFYQRLLDLEQIEVGGDALKVWEFARTLVLGGEFPERLNHHTSRFGLVIPSMVAQLVFGSQATSYYVAPLVSGVLLHVWIYLIGRKLSGPIGGAIGVVLLLIFAPMVRANSQILPEAFGPTYAAFATYAALLFSEAKTLLGRWTALVAVGIGLIFAYGAKESFLFFAPGVALVVWFGGAKGPLLPERWVGREVREGDGRMRRLALKIRASKLVVPAVLTALVLGLILFESLFLRSVTGASSRFRIISESHGGGGAHGPRIRELADFFALYTQAPADWQQALAGVFVAWLGLTAFARDRRSKLVGLTLLVFVLLQTFIVRSLDPLTPWFRPHPRYLLGMVGPMAMVMGIFLGDALNAILRGRRAGQALSGKERFFSLLIALVLLGAAGSDLPERYKKEWGKRDAWHKTVDISKQLTRAYRAGIPIVAETPLGKPAWAAAALYIDPSALLDENNRPVDSSRILHKYKSGRFVARAALSDKIHPRRLRNAVAHRVQKRKCAVTLRQSVRFIVGRMTFHKGCTSLEEEFQNDRNAGKQAPASDARQKSRARRPSASSLGKSAQQEAPHSKDADEDAPAAGGGATTPGPRAKD